MKISNLLSKKASVDAFDAFYSFSLQESEMNFVRGGDDPPTEDPMLPWPPRR